MSENLLRSRAPVTTNQTEIKPKQQRKYPRTGKVNGKINLVSLCITDKVADYKHSDFVALLNFVLAYFLRFSSTYLQFQN